MSDDKPPEPFDWSAHEEAERAKYREEIKRLVSDSKARTAPSPPLDLSHVIAGVAAAMAETACQGSRDNLNACTWAIESSCPKREFNSCPRRILAYEAAIEKSKKGDRSPYEILTWSGVPAPIARQLVAERYDESEAVEKARAWWQSDPRPRALWLAGNPGSGKTFAASWLVWRFGGRFVHVSAFEKNRKDGEWLEGMRMPAVVVIDDLGAERLDGFDETLSAIQRVICQRVDAGVFTVCTSNMGGGGIRGRYGDRVADRIKGQGWVRELGGDSLRRLA
jgi:hypothetical protein